MTPVATPIAVRAITWDAALEETLSRAAAAASPDGRSVLARTPAAGSAPAEVHSVHRRALNLLLEGELVSLVSADLDDAPATIRVAVRDWTALGVRQGDGAGLGPDGIRIETGNGPIAVLVGSAETWSPAGSCLCAVSPAALQRAADRLDALPAPAPQTDFGRASAALLAERVEALAETLGGREPAAVTAAAQRILGLGEGLTPSGDDVLMGLAFVAAHPGTALRGAVAPLSQAVEAGRERTTLLSWTTLRHALRARARQSLHDLMAALRAGDLGAFEEAAGRIREIGHTSGADILTGVRLALHAEAALRTDVEGTDAAGCTPGTAALTTRDAPATTTSGTDERGTDR